MVYVDKDLNTFGRYKDISIRVRNNATNGDVVKALFGFHRDSEHNSQWIHTNGNKIEITVEMDGCRESISFSKYWWDAPYERR